LINLTVVVFGRVHVPVARIQLARRPSVHAVEIVVGVEGHAVDGHPNRPLGRQLQALWERSGNRVWRRRRCGRSGILKMCTASRAVRMRQPAPAAGWGMLSSLSAACGSPAECITRKSSVQYAALTCGELACRYDESRMQTPSRDCLQILHSS
jgi:hypothetical protein